MISWRAPLRVELPWIRPDVDHALRVPVAPVSRAARLLTVVIPSVLVLVGAGLAVGAAVLAEREDTEAIGSLGLELGGAMWFAGVLTFFARRGATVGRGVGIAVLGLAGALLVGLALVLDATGAPLALAMEFGVAAVAVAVIDVVLLGLLYRGLTTLGAAQDGAVTLRLTSEPPFLVIGRDLRP